MEFSIPKVLTISELLTLFLLLVSANDNSTNQADNFIWNEFSDKIAKDGQFPWHVVLQKSKYSGLECGGSLISHEWILTSANCLRKLKSIYLIFGSVEYNASKSVHRISSNLYIHPAFVANRSQFNIGLIKLSQPVFFNLNVRAIKLLSRANANGTFANRIAEIPGYRMRNDKLPIRQCQPLHYFQLNILETEACKQAKAKSNSHLCIRSIDSNEPHCDGDTGGALVIREESGDYIQIGINPFRQEYCNWPTGIGYVHIGLLLDWIEQMTGVTIN